MTKETPEKMTDRSAKKKPDNLARLPKSLLESAQVVEDRRKDNRGGSDRRRDERAAVDAMASLSANFGDGAEGHLYNLSAFGCSLQLTDGSFPVGEAVWFSIDAMQPWRGTVRWIEDDKVGVEFDRPFYPALFELLVQSNKPISVSQVA